MTRRTINLDDTVYDYLQSVSLREAPLLAALRQETAKLPGARMQIAPDQGQFMALLARLSGAVNALEVGVYTGYSALAVATVLPQHGRLIAMDVDEETTAIARRYWRAAGVDQRIELRLGDATATLDELLKVPHGHFDFAFIDADKERYEGYFERVLTLLRPGGLICVDNVLWGGRVANPQARSPATRALQAFNLKRLDDARVDISLVPVGDGLLLARKR